MSVTAAAVGGAAVGGGLNILGGLTDYYYSRSLSSKSRRHARRMMQNRYVWTMQDLRNAGLNPLLAIGNAQPGAPGGNVGMGGAGRSLGRDTVEGGRMGAMLKAELDRTNATAANQLAGVRLQDATTSAKQMEEWLNKERGVTEQVMQNQIRANTAMISDQHLGVQLDNLVRAAAGEKAKVMGSMEKTWWSPWLRMAERIRSALGGGGAAVGGMGEGRSPVGIPPGAGTRAGPRGKSRLRRNRVPRRR